MTTGAGVSTSPTTAPALTPPLALDAGTGAGLLNMRDRLDAVGGSVTIISRTGSGTVVRAVAAR